MAEDKGIEPSRLVALAQISNLITPMGATLRLLPKQVEMTFHDLTNFGFLV